jgi:transcription initiation factor IIF auxiliary subunit
MTPSRGWFRVLLAVVWTVAVWSGANFISAQAMAQATLEIQNVAESIGNNEWKWTAFVTGLPAQIEKIRCVRYTLHPTFPEPIQDVCNTSDPKHPFALTMTGWGTFNLRARISFKDGSSSDLSHFLEF